MKSPLIGISGKESKINKYKATTIMKHESNTFWAIIEPDGIDKKGGIINPRIKEKYRHKQEAFMNVSDWTTAYVQQIEVTKSGEERRIPGTIYYISSELLFYPDSKLPEDTIISIVLAFDNIALVEATSASDLHFYWHEYDVDFYVNRKVTIRTLLEKLRKKVEQEAKKSGEHNAQWKIKKALGL
jgi:hypothetical protein